MTSEEIRRKIDWLQEGASRSSPATHDAALYEIALQLAKMNERMDIEDEKFFGGRPSGREREKVSK
jgi:hypothetical protein